MIHATFTNAICGLRENLNQVLLGKPDKIELVLACLLARGHLLLDDLPGLGKTTLAKAIAGGIGAKFARIQCTPDLLPTDVTGFNLFNQKTREFEFQSGPVFADVLLADELNRTTPRTQSALFEAMAERQVTIDGETRRLPKTFFVIATQNPIDSHGAYPLPEAQLDRFAMRLQIGYPDADAQLAILNSSKLRLNDAGTIDSLMTTADLEQIQAMVATVHVSTAVQRYIIEISEKVRAHDTTQLGISPRGLLIWQEVARAWAFLQGREFVIPVDVQDVAEPTVAHRIVVRKGTSADLLRSTITSLPIPSYQTS